jgi:hypothetical protein
MLPVKELRLDLANFRTTTQQGEAAAIHAMVSVSPDWFWALTESILDEGYHPTENILVLRADDGSAKLVVKEGNRRIQGNRI